MFRSVSIMRCGLAGVADSQCDTAFIVAREDNRVEKEAAWSDWCLLSVGARMPISAIFRWPREEFCPLANYGTGFAISPA